jgi:hypothetical protein
VIVLGDELTGDTDTLDSGNLIRSDGEQQNSSDMMLIMETSLDQMVSHKTSSDQILNITTLTDQMMSHSTSPDQMR